MSATDRKGNSRQEGFLFIAKDPEQLNEQKQNFLRYLNCVCRQTLTLEDSRFNEAVRSQLYRTNEVKHTGSAGVLPAQINQT